MKNFYEILGVQRAASQEEIKKNYRTLSKKYHPDLNQDNKVAEAKFKEISQAYGVLSNTKLRQAYDEKLVGQKKPEAPQRPQDQPRHSATGEVNLDHIARNFGQFFGFDPKSKDKKMNVAGSNHTGNKNPLDTSHIFESFFKKKKK